jgi:hypothetical protein
MPLRPSPSPQPGLIKAHPLLSPTLLLAVGVERDDPLSVIFAFSLFALSQQFRVRVREGELREIVKRPLQD